MNRYCSNSSFFFRQSTKPIPKIKFFWSCSPNPEALSHCQSFELNPNRTAAHAHSPEVLLFHPTCHPSSRAPVAYSPVPTSASAAGGRELGAGGQPGDQPFDRARRLGIVACRARGGSCPEPRTVLFPPTAAQGRCAALGYPPPGASGLGLARRRTYNRDGRGRAPCLRHFPGSA